jgi:hypothetical protein
MKRGERKVWRELAELAQNVAESKSYAEEFAAKIDFRNTYAQMCGGVMIPNNSFQPTPERQKTLAQIRRARRAGTR